MGDDHDRGPLGIEVVEQLDDGGARDRVEVAGGLVGQEQGRIADDGAGDGCGEAPGADDCVRVLIRYPNLPSTLILNGFQNLVRSTLLLSLNLGQQLARTTTVLP